MFKAEMRNLIAERQQEVIAVVVCGAEQRLCLSNQLSVLFDDVRGSILRFIGVGRDIQIVRRFRSRTEIELAEVPAGENWGIDQRS